MSTAQSHPAGSIPFSLHHELAECVFGIRRPLQGTFILRGAEAHDACSRLLAFIEARAEGAAYAKGILRHIADYGLDRVEWDGEHNCFYACYRYSPPDFKEAKTQTWTLRQYVFDVMCRELRLLAAEVNTLTPEQVALIFKYVFLDTETAEQITARKIDGVLDTSKDVFKLYLQVPGNAKRRVVLNKPR